MKTKAQIQMSETIFVVFIILIIVVLGFVAYSKFQEIAIKEKNKDNRNLDAIALAQRISAWPELECSVVGITEFVCLDITKLEVLGDFINESQRNNKYAFDYYYDLLRQSRIKVIQVYPMQKEWVVYENIGTTQQTDRIPIPVNLYNPFTKTFGFGVMELLMYK